MPKKSICDSCYEPGACCKKLTLSTAAEKGPNYFTSWLTDTPERVKNNLTVFMHSGVDWKHAGNFEFHSFSKDNVWNDPEHGDYAIVYLKCNKLQSDGRCGDYANRPSLCRSYQPLEDTMCAHYKGAESGDPTVPIPQEHHAYA